MRTDRDPIPRVDGPHEPKPEPEAAGTLVLIGGACSPHGHAFRRFLELSHAREGRRVVVLTTASSEPEESGWYWTGAFKSAGATQVEIPIFTPAADATIAAMIDDGASVFLGGGDQVKLVAALSGTRTCTAIRMLHRRGGVVGGTSAGAAALTQLTMAGGEIDEEGNLVDQYIGPGLGLLGFEALIDTHFSQRRRLQRLFLAIAANTQLFGLGIDEDTALVVRGHVGEVVGAGTVTFVDGRDTVRFDNAGDLSKGRQLTLSSLRVGLVGTKYHLDLQQRELVELLSGEPSPHRREPGRVPALSG